MSDSLLGAAWRNAPLRTLAIAASAAGLLAAGGGCGGGAGPDDGDPTIPQGTVPLFAAGPVPTTEVVTVVDAAQIGGSGLEVLSVHGAGGAQVQPDGAAVTVSAAGPQVLVAVDQAGAARGLAISLPGTDGSGSPRPAASAPLQIDARSTAMAFLLLCPGVGTTDPTECAARMQDLAGYASFAALVESLRQRLPTTSLTQLSQQHDFQQLVHDVVMAFNRERAQATPAGQPKASPQIGVAYPPGDQLGGIALDFPEAAFPEVAVTIRNHGYRMVMIQRREIHTDGSSGWTAILGPADSPLIAGARGWSNGTGLTVGHPATWTEVSDRFSMAGLTRAEYWITGPGFVAADHQPPADPPASGGAAAWGASVAGSVLWPMLGMLAGSGEAEAQMYARSADFGTAVWTEFGDTEGAAAPLLALAAPGGDADPWQRAARLKESLGALAQAMAGGPGPDRLADLTGLGMAQARALSQALKASVEASVLSHVVVPYAAWTQVPPVTVYALSGRDNAAFFHPGKPYVPADGQAMARCVYGIKDWLAGQARNADAEPLGAGAAGVPVKLTTSLGTFQASGTSTLEGETNAQGELPMGVVSSLPGVATVTAQVPGYPAYTARARLTFCQLDLHPDHVHVPNQQPFRVECTVAGPENLDELRFTWTSDADLHLVDPETGNPAPYHRIGPRVLCGRQQGHAGTGWIRVEARYIGSGSGEGNLGDYVGEAEAQVTLDEMHYDVTLMGLVTRTGTSTGVRYGPSFPKVDGAVSYGVRGSGFNDPLFYGSEYHGGIDTRRDDYEDLGTALFFSITSSSGSGDSDKTDEELIDNVAWRFAGGTWFMFPGFDPPTP